MAVIQSFVKVFRELFATTPNHVLNASAEADRTIDVIRRITEGMKSNG